MMEIPLLKSWIHSLVMDGLTEALVDPGKIDIRTESAGPTYAPARNKAKSKGRLCLFEKLSTTAVEMLMANIRWIFSLT